MILGVCAIISLIVGISMEGWPKGAHDGLGIVASILLVVFVTATSDYRQSLQFKDLDKEKKKITVQVTRNGYSQKISIYDLLPGDIVHLAIGDQVPADGLFIRGSSLLINESSLTGESEPVNVTAENPFLLSGTKVQDGSCKMLVSTVGIRTQWGKQMATLSEGGDDETPLQVKLNGGANFFGKIGLFFAVITFAVLVQGLFSREMQEGSLWSWPGEDALEMLEHFAVAVTIVVLAVSGGLPLAVTLSLCIMGKFKEFGDSVESSAFCSGNPDSALRMLLSCWLLLNCASDKSDDLIQQLVSNLKSCLIDHQKWAAMGLRLLAKNNPENQLKIARAGAIKPLIALISSSDPQLQENAVTAILNLSLRDENKKLLASSGSIEPLIRALCVGTSTVKENAACALFCLSQVEENKVAIGQLGAIPPLVNLLETGNFRGKKDASTALYTLCSVRENKIRAVEAGIIKPLLELMADFGSNMVDKSAFVLSLLVSLPEARALVVEEGGIPVLVKIIRVGSQRQKEIAVTILLQICEDSVKCRTLVTRRGAIPPLVKLSRSGTTLAKQKAEALMELLRQPRYRNVRCVNFGFFIAEHAPT
ncbi:hypothetical protein NMG60_11016528 [Bertholletia excelsa]